MNTSSENDRGSLDPTLEANKKTVMAYAATVMSGQRSGCRSKASRQPLSLWSDRPADRPPARFQHGLAREEERISGLSEAHLSWMRV
jgi:hypothetical protein